MRIKKLWIENYKKYKEQYIVFDQCQFESDLQKEIFENMNIVLFSGENGTGKTTILSFIAYIFRYIQRYRERLESNYIITYDIKINNEFVSVELEKKGTDIYININGEKCYIQELKIGRNIGYYSNPNIENLKQVTYDDIRIYLPSQVYVLGFDNAYRKLMYSSNYIGDRLVAYRDISASYDTTSRGNNISQGIANIYYKILRNKQLKKTLNSLGVELSDYVDIYINSHYYEGAENIERNFDVLEICDKYLIEIDSDYNDRFMIMDYLKKKKNYNVLTNLIDERIIYINEFYINKGGRYISIKDMSTGEKAFLFNLFSVCSNLKENSLIIWEEPETHLNVKWSKNIIPLLVELVKEKNIQWLLSSHSSNMIKNFFQNQIIRLSGTSLTRPDFNTFLANDMEIYERLFENEEINPFERKVIKHIENGDKNTIKETLDVLGESYLKFMIYKCLEN